MRGRAWLLGGRLPRWLRLAVGSAAALLGACLELAAAVLGARLELARAVFGGSPWGALQQLSNYGQPLQFGAPVVLAIKRQTDTHEGSCQSASKLAKARLQKAWCLLVSYSR